jgi:hypothetical protein
MGMAYDKAQQPLRDGGQPAAVQKLIASAIIDIAARGERDPDTVARQGLKALGLNVHRVV